MFCCRVEPHGGGEGLVGKVGEASVWVTVFSSLENRGLSDGERMGWGRW